MRLVYTGYQARKGLHTGTAEIEPRKVCHIKKPVNSYIFKNYQKHLFLCSKIEKLKMDLYWLFSRKKTVTIK